MTHEQKERIKKLALEITNNGGFALQNAEAGHEKAAEKYDCLRDKAYHELVDYLDQL